MIISKSFAIGHIPRTGGDACAKHFSVLRNHGLDVSVDDAGDHSKHDPFIRRFDIRGEREYGLTFRKLPSFYLAYVEMCVQRGIYPDYKPLPRPTEANLIGQSRDWGPSYNNEFGWPLVNLADRYLAYMYLGEFRVSFVLRQEMLLDDVVNFSRQHMDVTDAAMEDLAGIEHESLVYDHDPTSHWSRSTIASMYANNPLWAEMERNFY